MNKIKFISICLFAVVSLASSKAYAEIAQRIISLSPAITESIYSLQEEDKLLAITKYCNYPAETSDMDTVGTMTHPNVEKIYSMKPDLVLASYGLTSKKSVAKLRSLGIRVEQFKACKNFNEIESNYNKLAVLLDAKPRAVEVIKSVKEQLGIIKSNFNYPTKERVLWQVGAKPLVVTGALSFTNEFIELCGGVNIFNDLDALYPRVSREEVFVRNPDRIFIITMGIATDVELAAWRGFTELNAVKNNKVHIINANKVCRATPEGFLNGIYEVAKFMGKKGE